MAVLQSQLSQLTREQLEAMVMSAHKPRKLSMKISPKGAIQINGFGRWPVTLYREQMERLLDMADDIRSFIAVNASLLSVKQ